jgi:hypothetical protein
MQGKTAIANLPSNVVLHDKSEIGGWAVAKSEGEVIARIRHSSRVSHFIRI